MIFSNLSFGIANSAKLLLLFIFNQLNLTFYKFENRCFRLYNFIYFFYSIKIDLRNGKKLIKFVKHKSKINGDNGKIYYINYKN